MTEEIHEYIKKCRARGLHDSEITARLKGVNWHDSHIAAALNGEDLVPFPPNRQLPQSSFMAHGFWGLEYRLMFVSLWATLLAVGYLLHYIIGTVMERSLGSVPYGAEKHLVSMALAVVLFCYPLFLYMFIRTRKAEIKHGELEHEVSRMWFSHLTVVMTIVTIIAYSSFVIYAYQSSTQRGADVIAGYIFRVVAVCGIAASASLYFRMYEHRSDKR